MTFALWFRWLARKVLFMRELPSLEQYPVVHRKAAEASETLDGDLREMGKLNAELKKLEQSLPELPEDHGGGTGLASGHRAG